jgi:hypothetical protein
MKILSEAWKEHIPKYELRILLERAEELEV